MPWKCLHSPLRDSGLCVNHRCSSVFFFFVIILSVFLCSDHSVQQQWKPGWWIWKPNQLHEGEIRKGWVTIFLRLDNHVMSCSLSRDTADWCLSFISLALIWQSTHFIIKSAENLYYISIFSLVSHLQGRTYTSSFLKKKKSDKFNRSETHIFMYWPPFYKEQREKKFRVDEDEAF